MKDAKPPLCPHCETELDQLGTVEQYVDPVQSAWIPENLYRCRECRYGKNRFKMVGGVLTGVVP